MLTRNRIVALLSVLFVLGLVSACRTPAGRTAGETIDDATITTKVKAKLFDDKVVSGFAIGVETFEGEVTLTGAVDSEDAKERAGQVAHSVYGVKDVNNLLKVKPGS